MGLRERLRELAEAAMENYVLEGTDDAEDFARDASRIALESLPCRFGTTEVTCLSEVTPPVRWCDRCARLAELTEGR